MIVRIRSGEAVLHIRQDHTHCYKRSSAYALVNDGEGRFIGVIRPTDIAGFDAHQEEADIDSVCHLSYLEKLTPTSNTITMRTL